MNRKNKGHGVSFNDKRSIRAQQKIYKSNETTFRSRYEKYV